MPDVSMSRRSGLFSRLGESARTGFWFIPTLFAIAAMVAAYGLVELDRWRDQDGEGVFFGGGFDSASQLLSTVASSIMAFTVITFSITILALQLASSQFSPRVLRSFLRDRGSQVPLGIFIATFVFALLVLRTVRSAEEGAAFVPGIAVFVAIGLAIVSIGAFIYFINHVAHAVRAVTIMDAVVADARTAIERNYPDDDQASAHDGAGLPAGAPGQPLRHEGPGGVVVTMDTSGLVALAGRHGCVIEMVAAVGEYLPHQGPLARVHGGDGELRSGQVAARLGFGPERTTAQDVASGLRQLVDIAEKALSPGINDPTTAVQVIGRIEELLARLAHRPIPTGRHHDDDGNLRLVHPVAGWQQLVELAFSEIRHYGKSSLQVVRRQRAAVLMLLDLVPADRRPPLEEQLRALDAAAAQEIDGPDRSRADGHDRQGMGGSTVRR